MNTKIPVINLKGVSFAYPGASPVIKDLDFKFYKGDRISLIAPNGTGKTTLFHLIMGLLKPSEGSIEIFGQEIKSENDFLMVRRQIGMLFQDPDDQLFSPTVLEDVAFGPLNLGKSREEAIEISLKTLEFLGLKGFEDRITFKLSGGEKKLVSLATVLAMEPKVLLLDEPTSGLDYSTKEKLKKILSDLDISFIVISHEIDFLAQITDTLYTIKNRTITSNHTLTLHKHIHAHNLGEQPHEHD